VFSTAHKGLFGLDIDTARITGNHCLFHRLGVFRGGKFFSFGKKPKIDQGDYPDKKEEFKHP